MRSILDPIRFTARKAIASRTALLILHMQNRSRRGLTLMHGTMVRQSFAKGALGRRHGPMRRYFFDRSKLRARVTERHFTDRSEALRFLNRVKTNHDALDELRYWYVRNGRTPQSDRELMEYCATALTSGRLRVYERLVRAPSVHGSIKQVDEAPMRPTKSEGDRVTPSAMRGATQRTQPSSTQPKKPSIDVESQIASLQAAAESGAPFCEQCAKLSSGASK